MRVNSVRYSPDGKIFRLSNGEILKTHRYSCLGPSDDVIADQSQNAHVTCQNGKAQILPAYCRSDILRVGPRTLRLQIKEIQTEEELAGYHQLEDYHYRGKVLHGRRAPLIVRSEDPLLPRVLGYVELSTAFLMNRARAMLLDSVFHHASGDISWTTWKKATVRKYTNLIVRIARTVVSPEFRGLGIARILVKHAARFARDHWHVGKLKPLFIEITADMLRYVPFVESSGMHYIGDTEGNLARVNEDMAYILKNLERVKAGEILKEESGGIVDLQVSYATRLEQIEEELAVPRERLLDLLLRSPQRLSDENWALLHKIFRLPKPTFIMGLTRASENFVRRRIGERGLPDYYPAQQPLVNVPRLQSPIDVQECTLTLSAPLIRTRSTRKIQQAFGVSREMLTTTLFANINFTIQPGDIVLICGPSGAGKTTLLNLLEGSLNDPQYRPEGMTGNIKVPDSLTVTSLGPLPSSRPLVNAFGRISLDRALFALNVSGLAEAHLYVKRFRELSNGQRYRAMVAKLIASESDIWVADEFCATLDSITANIVSRNLRRCAKQLGITVILAAANWAEFIHELQPNTVVHLRAPWDYRVFSWDTFHAAIHESQILGRSTSRQELEKSGLGELSQDGSHNENR
ncbi:GNAT family N-acetyltransferase [Syntrophobacter fumaroxidans]|uniref:ABC transporter related n=1 Tax=Syntrophobacter fumaroxidans (strain DSM 10017 / MPOB) TaxID=335543 RepID=A0LPS9_SYNFM|nr:GNAT family N-acetyltransferase [Syntrophobacter fumaroxidans]ABK19431.1 ABC transporter related [Syntrophobacter fumaroxidans MPOB]